MSNHKYIIKSIEKPVSDVIVLELKNPDNKPVFNFKPGQYVMISYKNEKGGIENQHTFSIASSPTEKDHIKLGIKILGNFTQKLSRMKAGDEIFVSGGYGDFIFNQNKHKDVVFIAGGIGITPFFSAMKYATDNHLPNKISLIYSNKTVTGTIFLKEIKELEEVNKNIRTLFSITEQKIPAGIPGVINERINPKNTQEFLKSVDGKHFLICGPVPFMNAAKENLLSLGVNKNHIEMEEFSMIPDSGFWTGTKNVSFALGSSVALMLLPFYFIYNSVHGATAFEDLVSASIFGTNKVEEKKKEVYEKLAKKEDSKVIEFSFDNLKDIALTKSSELVNQAKKAITVTGNSNKAEAKAGSNKTAAPKPKTETSPATNTQAASNNNSQVIATTPRPITSASPVNATQPSQNQPATNQPSQTTPTPTTSVSAPHPTTPTQPQTPTPQQPTPTTPTPSTSVSAPSTNPTTPTQPTTTPTQPAPTTPTPSTSVSAPTPTTPTTPTNPTPSQPTPTQPTAPNPSTSVSAPSTNTGSGNTSSNINNPAPNTYKYYSNDDDDDERSRYSRDRDDDDDEDDD